MSILSFENLGLSFGAFDLFTGLSQSIANDSKIGLIGPNGIGKTSLLLILAGIDSPTTGIVYLAQGKKIGYLRQEAVDTFSDCKNTVYAEMQSVFSEIITLQTRLNQLEARMSAGVFDQSVLDDYGECQAAFEHAGGYEYDTHIQQTLEGLGLGKNDWQTPIQHLSGGQKTRALLARLLLEKPDLLFLDEPTNHLDIDAVTWLERTLQEWSGALLVVSHDRFFLDHTVTTIWDMNRSGIETYTGNYSAYVMQRQERWDYLEKVYKEEKERLLKEVDFIQRNWVRASTHGRALGLLRRLSRDISIIDHYGILALRSGKKWSEMELSADRPLDVIEAVRKVNAIHPPASRPPQIRPRLASESISGTLVLRATQLTVGYPGNTLFSVRNLELKRGECAALIGPNGSGKTSFLKVLMGELEPLAGETLPGAGLKIGYFAQSHDNLDPQHTVIEELQTKKSMQAEQARKYLATYLFRGDDVFKSIGMLSGGERGRLALALLAVNGANFLLLDEPTNHLDIPAREALQQVLEEFSGTILLVSHDRYLIDRLATQIWDIHDGKLNIFKGHYRDYLLRAPTGTDASSGLKSARAREVILAEKPILHGNSRETRRKAELMAQMEESIRQKEESVKSLSREIEKTAGQPGSNEKLHKLSWELAKVQVELEDLISDWEKVAV
jgi:ATP-binding cassette, subfamily F, member 3